MARRLFRSCVEGMILLAAFGVGTPNAAADWPPDLSLWVEPPAPTEADPFDIVVLQVLGDTGYEVISHDLEMAGNDINVSVLVQDLSYNPDWVFLQVVTPYGARFSEVGPLASGNYNVNAELWMTPWPNTSGGWLFDTASLPLEIGALSEALPGDYNEDGRVDSTDYTIWRDNLGTSAELPNDETPGSVTEADYDVWRAHFGESVGSGALAASSVPEPASGVLMILAALLLVACRRAR